METVKKSFRCLLSVMVVVALGACSSTSNLPDDDVYYSSKAQNQTQFNRADYQKTAQSRSDNNAEQGTGESFEYETEYSTAVGSGAVTENDQSTEYEFIDEYYDSDYASRISRFNGESTNDDYYDDSYTNCGGCGSSNFTFSLGMGMGYGWSMGYGYGWPSYGYGYPYYGWGYPYYRWGYPYYGSYWSGYNHGYWNGYWDGYYNGGGYYPGGGGYYPDYGYGHTSSYGPRGRGAGGSSIPRSGSGRSGVGTSNPSSSRLADDENLVSRSGGHVVNNDSPSKTYTTPRSGEKPGTVNPKVRPEASVRVANNKQKQPEANRLNKPKQSVQGDPSKAVNRYRKPTATREAQQKQTPRYKKPKSYESLPSRQPRSSKEYVRPTNSTRKSNANRSTNSTYNRSVKQNSSRSNYSAPRTKPSPSRSNTVKTRTTSTPKSYSSPSRKSSSPRSYSSPSRSSSTPSRSYSSPSRSSSSGSGSSGSKSSSSSSKSSGGRR